MLRRQAIRPLRKPLIVMTPKSLLRHKLCISRLDDLTDGQFHAVLAEVDSLDPLAVNRVILSSGRIYYELFEKRQADNRKDTALIRIEQLYPFPEQELQAILQAYPNVQTFIWCQEEPMNQGAWYCSQHHMRSVVMKVNAQAYLCYAGRSASAAPACGYMSVHVEQQEKLLDDAFSIKSCR